MLKAIFLFFLLCQFPIFGEEIKEEKVKKEDSFDMNKILNKVTPEEESTLEKKIKIEKSLDSNSNFFSLYKMNYILPYYYTSSAYQSVYNGYTPNNQKINNSEFKGQISVSVPLIRNLFNNNDMSIEGAFTELIFWQFYADSQYFRSTDTEATLFYKYHFHRNWLLNVGVDHQSNGKGGELERSWNRVFGLIQFSGENFFIQSELWGLIFQGESIDLHNPDIERYLGHDNTTLAYRIYSVTLALSIQNIESGMKYGNIIATASYHINNQLNFYLQYFNGYGQSLLEYNHVTQGAGIGLSFNNFL